MPVKWGKLARYFGKPEFKFPIQESKIVILI